MIAAEVHRCPRCNKILHSTLSRGYHNSNQPLVGFCGMCARELNTDSHAKGDPDE